MFKITETIFNRTTKLVRVSTKLYHKHTKFAPLFENAPSFANKVAVSDWNGSYTFSNIFASAEELSVDISKKLNGRTNERVMFLCPNDVSYVVALWGIWISGQIAVPLSHLHPENILHYYATDTNAALLVSSPKYKEQMHKVSKSANAGFHVLDRNIDGKTKEKTSEKTIHTSQNTLPGNFYENSNALILYTSGTTGNPKGVVLSHKNMFAQITTLIASWKWTNTDVMLHALPLHHVHGIHSLFCPLYIGATTVMLPTSSAPAVWSRLLNRTKPPLEKNVTVLTGVPTIYSKLIDEYENNLKSEVDEVRKSLKENVRLMIVGSAPTPKPLHDKWFEITGHKLLERYGMTEIGMCFSNEYDSDREPGYVGIPLPGITIKLSETETGKIILKCTNSNGNLIMELSSEDAENLIGEVFVQHDGMFKEYYNKPEATKKEFTEDGWFKTGDICQYFPDKKKFKMLGRSSVDIIKSGGYKISALQVETHILAHPYIKECTVLGVSDDKWGERIAAVIVMDGNSSEKITVEGLRAWAEDKMPKYWVPSLLKVVESIPKNAMGKVNKKELIKEIKFWYDVLFRLGVILLDFSCADWL